MRGVNKNNPIRWHGMRGEKTYGTWVNIKNRCRNKKLACYKNYGGRGIRVYAEWMEDFARFHKYISGLDDYGKDGYTLDRIDNNGNYEPGNLRWVDRHTQGINQRRFSTPKNKFMGVAKRSCPSGGYFAHITVKGEHHYLGSSETKHGAVGLRNNFIIKNGLWEYPVQAIPDYLIN